MNICTPQGKLTARQEKKITKRYHVQLQQNINQKFTLFSDKYLFSILRSDSTSQKVRNGNGNG